MDNTKAPFGVLILHGFRADIHCVSKLVPPLKALGLPVQVPLLRGHGEASPEALKGVHWQDWLSDARSALQAMLISVERVILVGHSMGALVAITLAAEGIPGIDALVLAAAAIDVNSLFAPGHLLHPLLPWVVKWLKRRTLEPRYADPTLAAADTKYPWVPTAAIATLFDFSQATRDRLSQVSVPTLILQSRNDSTVPPQSAQRLYAAIATPADKKQIVWFEHTEHEMFLDCEREQVIATVVEFIQRRLTSDSGAMTLNP